MKLIRIEANPIYSFSAYSKLSDNFFIINRLTDYGIFASNKADWSIINSDKLPNGVTIFTTYDINLHKYSFIIGAPGTYVATIKVNKNNISEPLTIQYIIDRLIKILDILGYKTKIDVNSRGNDILYYNKKVVGCAIGETNEYYYGAFIINAVIDKKFVQIATSINLPQVKLKNKTIMQRIGKLDNLDKKFDELYETIKNYWGWKFEESQLTWGVDQSLLIYQT